jgi:2-oxo-3-hexenedioate decarboxylase
MIGFQAQRNVGLTASRIESVAQALFRAEQDATPGPQTELVPADLTLDDAWRVQEALSRLYPGGRAGVKMGLTSRAKMKQVAVDAPIAGFLPASFALDDSAPVQTALFGQPRVEPEIVFVLARDVHGPLTAAEAHDAIAWVGLGIEVLDSRYRDFRFTLPAVVADNASAKRFVTGTTWVRPDAIDLANVGMILEVNGELRGTASSSAILDHPIRSLVALSHLIQRRAEGPSASHLGPLRRGEIVLAGAPMEAVNVAAGDDVVASAFGLGQISMTFA